MTCLCVARDKMCWFAQNQTEQKIRRRKKTTTYKSYATFLAKGVDGIFLSTTSDLVKQLLRCKMLAEFLHTLSPINSEVLIINYQELKTLPDNFWFYFSALLLMSNVCHVKRSEKNRVGSFGEVRKQKGSKSFRQVGSVQLRSPQAMQTTFVEKSSQRGYLSKVTLFHSMYWKIFLDL